MHTAIAYSHTMAAYILRLPQELIDEILTLVVDHAEQQPGPDRRTRKEMRTQFGAIRTVCRTFDQAFTSAVIKNRPAYIDLDLDFTGRSWVAWINNPTLATHQLFVDTGRSIDAYFPFHASGTGTIAIVRRLAEMARRCRALGKTRIRVGVPMTGHGSKAVAKYVRAKGVERVQQVVDKEDWAEVRVEEEREEVYGEMLWGAQTRR